MPWFLWLYLIVVGINVLLHRRAEQQEFHNKYLDYRALAEGLRVQVFWHLAGLRDEAADSYLGKQRSELDWIRNALRARSVLSANTTCESTLEWLRFIQRQWIQEQKSYFARKAHREMEELERAEKRIKVLLASSVALTISLALVLALPIFVDWAPLEALKHWVEQPWPHAWIMIAIVMLAVCAGLWHTYNQQKAHAEHAKRYGRMAVLFDYANLHMERMLKDNRTREIPGLLRELGEEALAENGEWVLIHRERPLEVPHAA